MYTIGVPVTEKLMVWLVSFHIQLKNVTRLLFNMYYVSNSLAKAIRIKAIRIKGSMNVFLCLCILLCSFVSLVFQLLLQTVTRLFISECIYCCFTPFVLVSPYISYIISKSAKLCQWFRPVLPPAPAPIVITHACAAIWSWSDWSDLLSWDPVDFDSLCKQKNLLTISSLFSIYFDLLFFLK